MDSIEIQESPLRVDGVYKHNVILHNDSVNHFDHVESCLVKICKKSKKEAKKIAREAHNQGRAVCYSGSLEECETVAEALGEQGLTVSFQ